MATPLTIPDTDELIDSIIAKKGPAKYTDGLSEDNWEQEIEQIPLFMTKTPTHSLINQSPALSALQQIKYQDTTPEGRASGLKDEGNEMFKLKRYKEAIELYSQSLNEPLTDIQLIGVLYCNRSAAHYHIGNYRSSINDAVQCKDVSPTHIKAYIRGAEAHYKLLKFQEVIDWCNEGLKIDSINCKLLDIKKNAIHEKKKQERDERKFKIIERKNEEINKSLIEAIKLRGITLAVSQEYAVKGIYDTVGVSLERPHLSGGQGVWLNDRGELHWPVLFLYPEYGTSDYIESFNENDKFIDHINIMFNERASWDKHYTYIPNNIEVWYEDYTNSIQYIQVSVQCTLSDIINHSKQYIIINGSPCFIILATDTHFKHHFIKKKLIS